MTASATTTGANNLVLTAVWDMPQQSEAIPGEL